MNTRSRLDVHAEITNKLINTVVKDYGDIYADKCPLK